MTATATTAVTAPRTSVHPLVRTGLVATLAASVATTVVAAVGHGAGISLDISGKAIPLFGFPQLTAIFSLIGLGIAVVLAGRAGSPRTTFVRTTVALTALSLIPDAMADAPLETKGLLMLTHLVAAAIVIPALTSRLPE
ncbi:MAG TPA: DUF6069 family protein [Sporichthya sp.]|nr:DUF6069 family protein [Sporichthya sp.]